MARVLPDLLAPHYCASCGDVGALLCEHCKYDIINDPYDRCVVCGRPVATAANLCTRCHPPYSRAWCVGERAEALKSLMNVYKFDRARAGYWALADLLDATLPLLPPETVVVSVPTIAPHLRRRGYDHAWLVAKQFARLRHLTATQPLVRQTHVSQTGASRAQRIAQAKTAFACRPLNGGRYLLVDDVYTTGATLQWAAHTLLEAGATEVWVAVLSRQSLEK